MYISQEQYALLWTGDNMRVKRVEKFKKLRYIKFRKMLIATVVLPVLSILVGYVITTLFILPSMAK